MCTWFWWCHRSSTLHPSQLILRTVHRAKLSRMLSWSLQNKRRFCFCSGGRLSVRLSVCLSLSEWGHVSPLSVVTVTHSHHMKTFCLSVDLVHLTCQSAGSAYEDLSPVVTRMFRTPQSHDQGNTHTHTHTHTHSDNCLCCKLCLLSDLLFLFNSFIIFLVFF